MEGIAAKSHHFSGQSTEWRQAYMSTCVFQKHLSAYLYTHKHSTCNILHIRCTHACVIVITHSYIYVHIYTYTCIYPKYDHMYMHVTNVKRW